MAKRVVATAGDTRQCSASASLDEFWGQGHESHINGDGENTDVFTFYSQEEFGKLQSPPPPGGHQRGPVVNNLIDFAACNWRISDDDWLPETRAESEENIQMRKKEREAFVNVLLARSNRVNQRETLLLWRTVHIEHCLRRQLTTAEEENQALRQRIIRPTALNPASALQTFCAGQSPASLLRRGISALWMLLVTAAGAPALSIFAMPFIISWGPRLAPRAQQPLPHRES